jgi:predicted transcriptional regulator
MSSEKARIFGRQLAAARELLNITQAQLAVAAGVHQPVIARIEAGTVDPRPSTVAKLREAIDRQGVEFTNGKNPGVRFKDDRAFRQTP